MTGMDGRKDGSGAEPFWVVTFVVEDDCNEASGILRNAVYGSKAQAEIKMMAAANNDLRTQRESGGEARMRRFNDGTYDGVVVTGDAFTCDYRLVPMTFG